MKIFFYVSFCAFCDSNFTPENPAFSLPLALSVEMLRILSMTKLFFYQKGTKKIRVSQMKIFFMCPFVTFVVQILLQNTRHFPFHWLCR